MILKRIIFLVCFFFAAGLLLSCKSSAPVQQLETVKTVTVTETVHDTVFKIEKDNSYYEAYLDCVNGKVVVKSEKLTPSIDGDLRPPKVDINNNRLTVDCEKHAQELLAQYKATHTNEVTIKEVAVPVPVPLTNWQVFQLWCGRIFLLLLCITLLGLALKLKLK